MAYNLQPLITILEGILDLSHLHKLEKLRCVNLSFHRHFKVTFPCGIKNLHLSECEIGLEVLRSLRSVLHELEVLTISACKFINEEKTSCEEEWLKTYEEKWPKKELLKEELEVAGEDKEEWEVAEEDVFCSLQFLCLDSLRIVRWIADETNFPRLCHLRLHWCFDLEEIPSGIGEIPTLQLIELLGCTKSAVTSADRIVEEQSEYGNKELKLRIIDTVDW